MRARIRRVIEKTMERLQLKALETKSQEEQAQQKTAEYRQKQAEFNEYVRRYTEIQQKIEAERLKLQAQYGFAQTIRNMIYSLNGLPQWQVSVMMPKEYKLDESTFIQNMKPASFVALERVMLETPANESNPSKRPPINPPAAVAEHRQNVLVVKELLIRANLMPRESGQSKVVPGLPLKATITFTDVKI